MGKSNNSRRGIRHSWNSYWCCSRSEGVTPPTYIRKEQNRKIRYRRKTELKRDIKKMVKNRFLYKKGFKTTIKYNFNDCRPS
jgi:hypothetical protein